MGASVGNPVQPPTVFELEEALAERVQTRELLGRNWRNRVYRVQLATGDAALAKQVVMGRWNLDSQIRRAKTGSSRDESSHGPTDQQ